MIPFFVTFFVIGPDPSSCWVKAATLHFYRRPVVLQVADERLSLGRDPRDARAVVVDPNRGEVTVGEARLRTGGAVFEVTTHNAGQRPRIISRG
jgi:hypothetical protein